MSKSLGELEIERLLNLDPAYFGTEEEGEPMGDEWKPVPEEDQYPEDEPEKVSDLHILVSSIKATANAWAILKALGDQELVESMDYGAAATMAGLPYVYGLYVIAGMISALRESGVTEEAIARSDIQTVILASLRALVMISDNTISLLELDNLLYNGGDDEQSI